MLKWLCLVSVFFVSLALADTTARDFARYQARMQAQSGQVLGEMKSFSPQKTLKDYSEHPKEQQYYQGTTAEASAIDTLARAQIAQDEAGKTVLDHFATRARFEINTQSPSIQNAKAIENDSHAIVAGSDSDCQEAAPRCTRTFTQEICQADNSASIKRCSLERQITVESKHSRQAVRINFLSYFMSVHPEVMIDLAKGQVSTAFGPIYGTQFSSLLEKPQNCQTITVSLSKVTVGWSDVSRQSAISVQPSCRQSVLTLTLPTISWGYQITVDLELNFQSKPYIVNDEWGGACAPRESENCYQKSSVCLAAGETRMIDGLAVTRECWKKEDLYQCNAVSLSGCDTLKARGCSQIGSRCEQSVDGVCTRFSQVYQCPLEECLDARVCPKKVFCADGSCTPSTPTQNQDFAESVSKLAAVSEAGTSYQESNVSMFAGRVKSCKVHTLNYLDCCSNKGWGKSLNLANCSDEDRALGRKKKDYLVHYLGQYCSHRDPILHSCLTHKNVYCVFDSKIARIMQEARITQLNAASLGSAENPSCAGILPEELEGIDMSRIDFTAPIYPAPPAPGGRPLVEAGIASDMSVDGPSDEATIEAVTHRIYARMGQAQ